MMRPFLPCLLGLLLLHACGPQEEEHFGPSAAFTVRGIDDLIFGDVPFPSDLMRAEDGSLEILDFPNPTGSPSLQALIDTSLRHVHGFGLQSGSYFTFDGPLDPTSLPSPHQTVQDDSPVWIVDVDEEPSHRGERFPAEVRLLDGTHWMPENSLVVLPLNGFPLRDGRRYAVVLTDGLRGADGLPIGPAPDLLEIRDGSPRSDDSPLVANARAIYQPAADAVESFGLPRRRIRAMAVFTTQAVVPEMEAIREVIHRAAPAAIDWRGSASRGQRCGRQFEAAFTAPVWQVGEPPFRELGTGGIVFVDGEPVQQGTVEISLGVTIPSGTAPENGWPLVIYGHGSSGSRWSHAGRIACDLVEAGFAIIGLDFPLHGARPGTVVGQEELLSMNPANPVAARNFHRQGASDLVALARAVRSAGLRGPDGERFDTDKLLYLSQSMGGFTGPIALAVSGDFHTAAMNGAGGGHFVYYMPRTPFTEEIGALLTYALTVFGVEREEIDRFHPFINLAQIFVDVADSVSFARHLAREPLPGRSPVHLLFTVGDEDQYVAPVCTEALAIAAGVDVVASEAAWLPLPIELQGREVVRPPFSGNRTFAGAPLTVAMHQYHHDHFALSCKPSTRAQVVEFFRTALESDLPVVVAEDLSLVPNECAPR